jgi:glycerol-3-phosphate dehydrogenase
LHIIKAEDMRTREPHINPEVSGALWAPTGGICDPFMVTVAAAENAVQNGVTVLLETAFQDFVIKRNKIVGIKTNRGVFGCRWAINAAGINSDFVMHQAGVRPDFVIKPRRGEYAVLDRMEIQINNVLFPVPSQKGKGILVTTTTHKNAIIGPNANFVASDDTAVSREGLAEIWQGAQKLVPDLKPGFMIAMFAGLRAHGNAPDNDFIIEIPAEPQGLVNLGGIESPGLTAAPAIALRVIELLSDAGEKLVDKPNWDPIRNPRPRFHNLPRDEKLKLIEQDPLYGKVICRCETVTEGEILAEIRAPIPARTYDAIKRRTWLGTGRCQGSFDMPRVVAILARELNVPVTQITKKGADSEFIHRRTKDVEVQHG